jgi:hypothetical protein
MQRLLLILLLVSLCANVTACGNVFVRGALLTDSSITGSVSIVQLSSVSDRSGSTIQVTFVTFLQEGTSSSMTFCGNQTSLFPPNQTVRAQFNPGSSCATIITVVIIF